MLKVLGIVLVLTLGLFFTVPFFLDDSVSIEREIIINSNSEIIFEAINEIRVWEELCEIWDMPVKDHAL